MVVSLNFFAKNRKKLGKLVLVGGAFDIIHIGHVHHLKKAKSLGDALAVHITSDAKIREKKGPSRPVFGEKTRAEIVSAISFVDYVFIYNGRHYDQKAIDKIGPDILFFNQESYEKGAKEAIKKLKNFHGKIMVSKGKKNIVAPG